MHAQPSILPSTGPAIRVEGVWKKYCKRFRRGVWYLGKDLARSAVGLGPFDGLRFQEFWSLADVSFEVKPGECVGVIGANGAGKSTLLKILSGIFEPSRGRIEVRGRVGSLLEVGTGFHPDLSGRENIYLNGSLLGMKRQEVGRKFDEIVDFAGVEEFLDSPVRFYSSGMYMRLAFAVAAHLETEILLVDEVLAVGDEAFQRKCLGKMGEAERQGRSVLLVTHNMAAVRSLCTRALFLEQGRPSFYGSAEVAISRYQLASFEDLPAARVTSALPRPQVVADSTLRIVRVAIAAAKEQAIVEAGKPLEVELEFRTQTPLKDVLLAWSVHASQGVRLFECRSSDGLGILRELAAGHYVLKSRLPENPLNPGLYTLHVGARCADKGLDWLPDVLTFKVESKVRLESLWMSAPSGLLRVASEWSPPVAVVLN